MMKTRLIVGLVVLLAAVFAFAPQDRASAATCTVGTGAIVSINAALLAGCDDIVLPTGTYTENLVLLTNVTIRGEGSAIIKAALPGPVIVVNSPAKVILANLAVTGGSSVLGGGIANNGTLTLQNVTVTGNAAVTAAGSGGGIANNGSLTIIGSTISGNTAVDDAGAIANNGTVVVSGSVISNNTAGDKGGAIANAGSITITGSIISGNVAGDAGGAIVQRQVFIIPSTRITASNIFGNISGGFDIEWIDSTVITAKGNWWGSPDGPSGMGPGSGDSVSSNVLFDDFLTQEAPVIVGVIDLPTDGRVNWKKGDLEAVIFEATDAQGRAALHIYCVNAEGFGYLGMTINQEDIEGLPTQPESNITIKTSDLCNLGFYLLTTGQFQINIGPNEEGKVYVTIFNGLPPANVVFDEFRVE